MKRKLKICFSDVNPYTKSTTRAFISDLILDSIIIRYDFIERYKSKVDTQNKILTIFYVTVKFLDIRPSEEETSKLEQNAIKTEINPTSKKKPTSQSTCIKIVEKQKEKVFGELGKFPKYKHSIKLLEGEHDNLNKRAKPFRFSVDELQILKDKIDELLSKGIISHSTSNICSPGFLVNKGKVEKRLVIDYTTVNKASAPDHFPLPSTISILNQLQAKRHFSKGDLSNGYFHVELGETTKVLTSFVDPQDQFQFNRLPFGLSSGPQVLQ